MKILTSFCLVPQCCFFFFFRHCIIKEEQIDISLLLCAFWSVDCDSSETQALSFTENFLLAFLLLFYFWWHVLFASFPCAYLENNKAGCCINLCNGEQAEGWDGGRWRGEKKNDELMLLHCSFYRHSAPFGFMPYVVMHIEVHFCYFHSCAWITWLTICKNMINVYFFSNHLLSGRQYFLSVYVLIFLKGFKIYWISWRPFTCLSDGKERSCQAMIELCYRSLPIAFSSANLFFLLLTNQSPIIWHVLI